MTLTWLGCTIRFSSRTSDFHRISTRDTFMPPAVEPAQPPENISTSSAIRQKVGHMAKSTVAKPVVVMMVTVWNAASVMEPLSGIPACNRRHRQISSVIPTTTAV